jgi:hypothetical protein
MANIFVRLDEMLPYPPLFTIHLVSTYSKLFKKKELNMRTKKGFRLRNVCGENIIVAEGIENIDFSQIISMNETSSYLWENVVGKDFTEDDLVSLLTSEYEVDADTAGKDVRELVEKWKKAGIIEA